MDTARAARGKVPDYPRPVPDFDYDELPLCPNTVIYESWTDDAEREAEERAKKRQKRRREVAETYLRGGEIRILTAGLRGPFEGWKNPWAKKRQTSTKKVALEVPETTARRPDQLRPKTRVDEPMQGSEMAPIDLEEADPTPILPKPPAIDAINPFVANPQAEKSAIPKEPSSTKRVEDWLRTNDMYARRSGPHVGSSPTPTTRSPKHHQTPPQPRTSPIRSRPSDREPATILQEYLQQVQEPVASRPSTGHSEALHESPLRAEAAILEHKRRSLHKLPPSTNLPEFKYRRGRREQKNSGDKEAVPAPEAISRVTAPANEASKDVSGERHPSSTSHSKSHQQSHARLALSAETSKTSTIHNLPSAQVASVAPLTSMLNGQSTDEILPRLPPAPEGPARNHEHTTSREDLATVQAVHDPEVPAKGGKQQALDGPEHLVQQPVPTDHTPIREPETQEMIAALKPFELSTIKKPIGASAKRRTPATASKVPVSKAKKRASFAVDHPLSDDSQKSIKMGMKVKKAVAPATTEKVTPKVALFEAVSVDLHSAPEAAHISLDDSLPSLSSMFGQKKPGAPKSILKSSNAISSVPVPSGHTASTSMKQDAQILSGQAGQVQLVDEDDGFDLDAAIDDLGSYLGTWDADEEATKLSGG